MKYTEEQKQRLLKMMDFGLLSLKFVILGNNNYIRIIIVRPTLELNQTAFLNEVTRRTVIDFRKAFLIYRSYENNSKNNN